MQILVGCEESQAVCIAFRERGHEAFSCDLEPPSGGYPEWHLQMDVFEAIKMKDWDLGVFFPPCTRLCNSGVRWLKDNSELYSEMEKAAVFFKSLLNAPITRIAVENPIPHKYALEIIGRKYDQIVQPWEFGHGETKATCLWLKNLPPLMSTALVTGREQRIWRMPPSPDRAKLRSKTFSGVAKAIAAQWSDLD